jgi:Ca-activated chloride channel family protein
MKDDSGQFVKSRLDEAGLKEIAGATGGLYSPLGAQGQGLDTIYQQALAPLARHDLASRRQKVYTERYQWPLAAALGFLLASMLVSTRRRITRKSEVAVIEPARPWLVTQGAAALLGATLFLPFNHAEASTSGAEKAYQKGDFATAQREYDSLAKRNPKKPELEFNAGTAAYKAGRFPQAAEAFQKSLGGKQSADPKRLAAQEDAFYNLGNTLYRTGQQTEQSNPQQTIQNWEQAVKTYEAALQLRADDTDAKYNRDLVKRKLEELKKQQQQQQQNQQNQKQDQQQDQQKQDQQNQSGQNSDQKNQESKDQKQDQQQQTGQSSDQKNQQQNEQPKQQDQSGQNPETKNEDQKSGADSKPEQQKEQQQANNGSQPDQQKQPDQKGKQPQPANGQPQGNAQANTGADQRKHESAQAEESQREPGQMSKEEARNLLDSLKNEQRRLPAAPLARSGSADNRPDKPFKDW